MSNDAGKSRWRKVLYERQPFPDNFIDPVKFFDELDIVVRQEPLSLASLILGATVVVQQFTLLVIFLAFYQYIIKKKIDIFGIVLFDVLIVCISLILLHFMAERDIFDSLPQNVKTALIVGMTLRVAAPILQNLTLTFSDDTIHALTFFFSFIHLVFHNYQQSYYSSSSSSSLSSPPPLPPSSSTSSSTNQDRDVISGNVSINAIILITVLLASRMPQIEMVFAFVILATIGFSFVPRVADAIKKRFSYFHLVFIVVIWLFASYLLFNLNKTLFVIYQILFHFLLFVCPFWLIKMQACKKSLRGPWDIG